MAILPYPIKELCIMENINTRVITANTIALGELSLARGELFEGLGKIGQVITNYAVAMCHAFDTVDEDTGARVTPWYDLKGKLKAGVKEERARFVAGLESLGYKKGTIDVYWQRVKIESGYTPAGSRASGSTSDDDKNLADLRTIINRIFKMEEAGTDTAWSDVKGELIEAFEQMGGDVDGLGQ